jgi:hypothetical protein
MYKEARNILEHNKSDFKKVSYRANNIALYQEFPLGANVIFFYDSY